MTVDDGEESMEQGTLKLNVQQEDVSDSAIMRKTKYRRWQVILGVIGFLLIMGAVGKVDQDSLQASVDEKTNIRDQLQAQVAADEQKTVAHYDQQVKDGRP
jgi:cell division protein FtsB